MSSTETIPSPARTFFRELFSTYGWVVVLVVGVIGAFFAQLGQVAERAAKVETKIEAVDARISKVETSIEATEQRVRAVERQLAVIDSKLDRVLDTLAKKP